MCRALQLIRVSRAGQAAISRPGSHRPHRTRTRSLDADAHLSSQHRPDPILRARQEGGGERNPHHTRQRQRWARTTTPVLHILPSTLLTKTHSHARDRDEPSKEGDDDQEQARVEKTRAHDAPGSNASRQDRLGGDVEPGAVVAAAGGLLRAVAQPRRQDRRVLLPLLPGRIPAALPREPLQGLLLLPLLRQARRLRRHRLLPPRRRRQRRLRRPWRRQRGAAQPLDEGGGHRGGGAPHGGRRRRRRPLRRLRGAPQEGPLRDRLRRRLLHPLLLLRTHPLGRQPQPEARRLRQQRHLPQLRDPGRHGRLAGAHGALHAQRHCQAHLPQHRELLRRARHRAARHILLLPAPHGLRRPEVLLPGEEEQAQRDGDGDGQQGAALRRRLRPEQHPGAQGRGPAAGAAGAGGEDQVQGAGAGEAGEAHVLHQRAVQRQPGDGKDRQGHLPQEELHPSLATTHI